jgi:formylglycine-generating enzyme required for sulfatase activity
MRYFGGGTFVLADGSATVSARPFCLDVVEVTAVAYGAFVRAGGCSSAELACSRAATYGDPERATHPINCVSWLEADAFCRFARKRLPSEGEWEWAARGGARATPFPWGSAPPARRACWDGKGNALGKGGRKETCPVGTHPDGDSPEGLSDLSGSVREWTSSSEGRFRVVRGGSWGDSLPDFLSVAFRGMNAPDERFELTGFRCAADSSPNGLPSAPPAVARAPRAAPPSAPPATPVPVFQVDAIRIDVRASH